MVWLLGDKKVSHGKSITTIPSPAQVLRKVNGLDDALKNMKHSKCNCQELIEAKDKEWIEISKTINQHQEVIFDMKKELIETKNKINKQISDLNDSLKAESEKRLKAFVKEVKVKEEPIKQEPVKENWFKRLLKRG